ncbi:TraR/DksA C4-type zinc finger protein [Solidesulfovibrio sp.]
MGHLDVELFGAVLRDMLETLQGKSRASLDVMAREETTYADMADRATVESDRHMALLMGERDRQLIGEIHEALARVKEGEYGICQECGEDIGLARLRAQPMATLCVHCKSLLEDMGQSSLHAARGELVFMEE